MLQLIESFMKQTYGFKLKKYLPTRDHADDPVDISFDELFTIAALQPLIDLVMNCLLMSEADLLLLQGYLVSLVRKVVVVCHHEWPN